MIYALYGFLVGLFIPYTARRFAKFMPATPGYALWQLLRREKKAAAARLMPAWFTPGCGGSFIIVR